MSEPRFLEVRQVEQLHADSLARHGGSTGIRDFGALESAVFSAQNVYFYSGGDLYEIAAAYAFHIAEAQAFIDGNKRAAVSAALTFLEGNGIETHTSTTPLHEAMISIAKRELDKAGLAELLRTLFP